MRTRVPFGEQDQAEDGHENVFLYRNPFDGRTNGRVCFRRPLKAVEFVPSSRNRSILGGRNKFEGLKDVCLKNGSSQGQNLALTVLFVPN